MRITCPSCDATYDVPDAMLGAGGRMVRCARCGNEWMPGATSVAPLPPDEPDLDLEAAPPPKPRAAHPAAAAAEPESDAPEAHRETDSPTDPQGRQEPRLRALRPRTAPRNVAAPPPEPVPPPRAGLAAIAAWAASILLLAGAAVGAVLWRAQVMSAWPPSERLFAALGLH